MGVILALVLNGCIACAQPGPSGLEAARLVPHGPALATHRPKHFVKTARAWRHCKQRYGARLLAAYESRNAWRCSIKGARR